MLQIKDFVKCGSPYTPFELHVNEEQMTELIKRDIAMDKILELRDTDKPLSFEEVVRELINITLELKK